MISALYNGEGHEVRQRNAIDLPVVVNAGGKGTRLDPFTRILPKPLIPVGEPFFHQPVSNVEYHRL